MDVQVVPDARADLAIVTVDGEIDIQSAPELTARLQELDAQGAQHVIVELSGVTFLDSSGLGALVAAQRSLDARGATFSIVGARPHIQKILMITRVIELIDSYDTVEDAVAGH